MSTAQQDDQVLVEPVNPEPMNPDADVQKAARLEPDGRWAASNAINFAPWLSAVAVTLSALHKAILCT